MSIRGRILTGRVVSAKMTRTIVIRRDYLHYIPKYNRYEKRHKNLSAHVSLFGSDYGLNTGAMIFRGHFTGNGKESTIQVMTKGGDGSCSALWLNGKQLEAWHGDGNEDEYKYNVTVGALGDGKENVLMVVVDQNGYDQSGSLESNMVCCPLTTPVTDVKAC